MTEDDRPAAGHPRAPAGGHFGGPPGGIVWLTGLSGAGKSTLAGALVAQLARLRPLESLDGDDVRTFLSAGLGFSRADRDTNVHRIAYVARLLARHGVLVLVAAISPYAETRNQLRELSTAAGHAFVEVFVHAPLATVIARDVKGLYKRAQAGELTSFTGISDPYEAPTAPDVEVRTDLAPLDACAARIVAALVERGLVPPT
jgi:adenylylsulfate kinase